MKIIYVTTTIDADDYKSFVSLWSKKPNPSNQNFHNKVIRALAKTNEVEVVSIRPFSRKLMSVKALAKEDKQIDGIKWHYLPIKGNKLTRFISIKKEAKKVFKKGELDEAIILTDTININCMNVATMLSKRAKRPVVGICTDSPSNITGTLKSYTMYLLKKASKLDGYIALTSELNTLFNDANKPHLIIEGIVENINQNTKKDGDTPYFFFGGSLSPRYGINALIEGFLALNRKDIKLVVAGHSGILKDYPNVEFKGVLDVKDVLKYEANAIANINPRPYSEDLDRFSIPSKTLEYMAAGRPVISVKNTILQKVFEDDVIWVNSSKSSDLMEGMNKALQLTEVERENIGEEIKNKVLRLYSLEVVGE